MKTPVLPVPATASSQYSTGNFSASKAIGSPNTGLAVGANGADNRNAWAEASADTTKINNITLTYASITQVNSNFITFVV
jgi:hypothetical protein